MPALLLFIACTPGANVIQQHGASLGIAVLATVFFASLDDPSPPVHAMAETTLLALVPLGLAFVAAFRLPKRARVEAARQISAEPL